MTLYLIFLPSGRRNSFHFSLGHAKAGILLQGIRSCSVTPENSFPVNVHVVLLEIRENPGDEFEKPA